MEMRIAREPEINDILLCEDHPFIQKGVDHQLRELISAPLTIRSALTGRKALELAKESKPDLAIIDLQLPDISGLEVVRELRKLFSDLKILVLTGCDNPTVLRQLQTLQVNGIVQKSSEIQALEEVLMAVISGAKGVFDIHVTYLLKGESFTLTAREYEVLEKMVQGYSNQRIAEELQCALTTIRFHRANIMQKGNFRNAAEVTAWFLKRQSDSDGRS